MPERYITQEQQQFAQNSPEVEHGEGKTRAILSKLRGFHQKHTRHIILAVTLADVGLGANAAKNMYAEFMTPELPRISGPVHKTTENPESLKKLKRIKEETGRYAPYEITSLDSVQSEAERQEALALNEKTRVAGFDRTDYLTDKKIEKVIGTTYPNGFSKNVRSVRYQHSVEMNSDNDSFGVTDADASIDGEIRIFNGVTKEDPEYLSRVMDHEVMHLQDWNSNRLLTQDERIELKNSILDRLQSPDRFKSWYVENIKGNDAKIVMESKALEYWAEIGSVYLEDGLLPAADKEIVEWVVHKTDPKFNPSNNVAERRALLAPGIQVAPGVWRIDRPKR